MSATIGTGDALTIAPSAAVDSSSGQETRTISAPAAAAAWTCSMVAAALLVKVLVMVCTEIGASPPTSTLPTLICRLLRRWISRYGRTLMARTSVCEADSALDIARLPAPQKPRPPGEDDKQGCRARRAGRQISIGGKSASSPLVDRMNSATGSTTSIWSVGTGS